MQQYELITPTDEVLHATEAELLERRVMELALERTGSRNGAIFLWDHKANGLAIHFHYVDGLVINLPGVVLHHRKDSRPNGIALWVYDHNQPYLCNETGKDPNYARYFQDVRSVAAVPIPYQKRAMGVISVSSPDPGAFSPHHIEELEELAASSAKFLRRVQLYWSKGPGSRRPFLIKGLSPAWLEVERQLEQVAPTHAPVLIHGESGTGKELLANAIHFNSERSGEPMVTVNCAAIPETLLESTLFGHAKGAFTGASYAKTGEFRKAHRGTLFLDEIGDMPLPLQAKLLRAVEDGEIQPLGSNDPPVRVDVRLVCATHHDLTRMVREGRFRDDLYYRLSVVTLELPPLRSYKNNLDLLCEVFMLQAGRKLGKEVKRVSAEATALLQAYEYPGNVRELKNIMEHAVIMTSDEEIRPEHLPRSLRSTVKESPFPRATGKTLRELREEWLAPLERQYLLDLLAECHGDVKAVAGRAGLNHVTVYRLLKRRGIPLRRDFT
jgi:transcriptional regulator with PAS, ATPase and Fis domain